MSDIVPASAANSSKQSMTRRFHRPLATCGDPGLGRSGRLGRPARARSTIPVPCRLSRSRGDYSNSRVCTRSPVTRLLAFPSDGVVRVVRTMCSPAGRPISQDNTWAAGGISRPRGRTGFSSGPGRASGTRTQWVGDAQPRLARVAPPLAGSRAPTWEPASRVIPAFRR